MAQLILGTFNDSDDADRAIRDLIGLGYKPGDLNVIMSDATKQRVLGGENIEDFARKSASGASIGAILGGALTGMAAGAAVSSGAIVAGPLAAAVAVAAGAAGGAIIGALAHAGLPPDQHAPVQQAIGEGSIVIAVSAEDDKADRVRSILQKSED